MQRLGQRLAQPLGLEKLPVVELGTVGQVEAGQKTLCVQGHRFPQRGLTIRAGFGREMVVVRRHLRQEPLIFLDIHP